VSDAIVRSSANDFEKLKEGETMQRHSGLIIAIMVAALPLVGCEKATSKTVAEAPAIVQKLESGIGRITLKGRAGERLGIQFVEVRKSGQRLEAPYNALLYDASGREWVFISPEPNVFMRTEIKVDHIEGDTMYFAKGLTAGTKLVTAGVAELYGIEFGVGK
jgi:hypothetical protein